MMKAGARNQWIGKVVEIKKGTIMCEVKVKVGENLIATSVMTLESLADLGIKEGDEVRVLAKAVNVLLIKE